ncbi:thiamine/thiamine pyrophosphate ABC transporter permease ThiP [Lutimaribacter sp. EGI FJ00015]|uniref:Thiamine/thiamine pyrophosphate ABC transporter permease ThiP n=1 Tax=Lutimaribacter degradans TaxID=2945989 RepID=A0ACC6A1R8_9RHOB|nr:thiamine/thiamine pyrophosphate ABC transporter permease ThiP [Lutimaribacter sp. EGI FJ00013]MCM2563694.1 thiamine/thiamine pyrophosphate ABC transporter permease ThiP [Lutimaribacter sp. EGI FJ00013]MCO0614878.1 thiamine/thiamine pyrophosphate ABC transporter permease ThiP [Lutimaribacter sp. EGI FJ00015]MCO0637546.1 thiamine/thiamine pyrophosphate ABC transporter permease ThiP [Lutimaribacter sp. EGI FJ00014]
MAGLLLLLFLLGPLAAVAWRAGGGGWPGPADMEALRFTVVQAVLSALLSVVLAVPLARALARRRFPGRGALITLLGAPFILPVIVAVLGLLAVFGRGGIVNDTLAFLDLPRVQIYGLHGVVLAHVFFNLPLATRMILQGWQAIPAERFRLAASLGMTPGTVLRVLERPMLREVLPGATLIVFALCLSSFAVALTLGGGPRATTLELAIYQAFHFDFDLGRAAVLAVMQMGLVMAAAALALRAGGVTGFGAGLDRVHRRWEAEIPLLRAQDAALIFLGALFLLTPLAAIGWRGVAGLSEMPAQVWRAAGVSLGVALTATALCLVMALSLAAIALRHGWVEGVGLLGLAISPLVIGTGLFLLVNPWIDPARLALGVTAVVNAVMALPFAMRVILPRLREVEATHGRLATSLGMVGIARLRWLILPRLRTVLGFAAGLTAALAMGDLGVIALFADADNATLPLQILRLMGAYQMQAAAGAGLLLLVLSLSLFWLFDRGGRHHAAV